MASNRRTTQGDVQHKPLNGANGKDALLGLAETSKWLQNALQTSEQTSAWMAQLLQLWLSSSMSVNETIMAEMRDMQKAQDALQLLAAQARAANRQLDICATQLFATLQQLYDSQLLWLGQWGKTVEAVDTMETPIKPERAVLDAWGKAQDEWLQASRNWIDSLNAAPAQG